MYEDLDVDPSEMDVYCRDQECGDPVPNGGGARKLRRMSYIGQSGFMQYHTFQCSVCGSKRHLVPNLLTKGYHISY